MKGKQLTALLFLFLPVSLFAWGHRGHQIVAELAMRQLRPEVRQKVQQLLGTMTPAEAGTWMDDIRGDAAYKYTAPWHYINIEEGKSYEPSADGDIITALNTAYNELQHMDTLSPQRLQFDMLVLFHLCGDLTQPLHVGYGSDKGGNNYQVQYNGKGTNLHHIWDSEVIENNPAMVKELLDHKFERSDATDAYQGRLKEVNFMMNLDQSRYSLQYVYKISGHKVDSMYIKSASYIIRYRLLAASDILANCLEQLFSYNKKIPIINKSSAGIKPQTKVDTSYQEVLLPKAREEDLPQMIGRTVFVCSRVYSVKFQEGSGVTFINMGGEYPNNIFTVVIMGKDRGNFNYKPEELLNGKVICITGAVKQYKGKPEIVVDKQDQIIVQ